MSKIYYQLSNLCVIFNIITKIVTDISFTKKKYSKIMRIDAQNMLFVPWSDCSRIIFH